MSNAANPPALDLQKSIDLRAGTDPVRERAQVAQLAQEFEAMLMLQMVRGMRQSMLDESSEAEGLGGDTMSDTFDVELTRHLASAGGVGLGGWLSQQLAARAAARADASGEAGAIRELGGQPLPLSEGAARALPLDAVRSLAMPESGLRIGPDASTAAAVSTIRQSLDLSGRESDTATDNFRLSMPLDSKTTSAYGWRSDPLNGRSTFHHGVDLRAAYGVEVPAAAAGKVVFAGERGGYGNMVIVQHASGVETRYAHLASIEVEPGASVDAGASIGRVGSTGRSTAPHLHFEVLVNGERVDPERIARLGRGPLKFVSQADD
jgi:murein DD-endopeptidase MepM/ murein hydrolase activator NlpD